jgi:hypothetical protein
MLHTSSGERCQYNQLEQDIHEFVFTEASRKAIDEWFAHLDTIQQSARPLTVMRFLVRSTAPEPMPIAYALKCAQKWAQENPTMHTSRVAFVHRSEFFYPYIKSFVRSWQMNYGNLIRFFPADRYEDAVRWLLADN